MQLLEYGREPDYTVLVLQFHGFLAELPESFGDGRGCETMARPKRDGTPHSRPGSLKYDVPYRPPSSPLVENAVHRAAEMPQSFRGWL
jgi:hypothetical protein